MNVQRIRTSALEIFIGRNKQKTFDTELAELKLNEKGIWVPQTKFHLRHLTSIFFGLAEKNQTEKQTSAWLETTISWCTV